MKLSFILPIYNVEKYLARCIDSIYNQDITERDFEIVCIDDGSPDESYRILEDYSLRHNNFLYLRKENEGVSIARNKGIEMATGDYLFFVDPDDYISPNVLGRIYKELEERQSDILVLRSRISHTGEYVMDWGGLCCDTKNYKGVELFGTYVRGSSWGVAFSRQLIEEHKLLFPEGVRNGEDAIFMTLCQVWSQSFQFCDVDFYNLYRREESASQNITESSVICMKKCLDFLNMQRVSKAYTLKQTRFFESMTYRMISLATNMSLMVPHFNYKRLITLIPIQNYLPINQSGFEKKRHVITLINHSFFLYYYMLKVKRLFFPTRLT